MLAAAAANGLSVDDTDKLVMEFLKARSYLLYTLELKLSCWGSPPHALVVLGHPNMLEARRGLQLAMDVAESLSLREGASADAHPMTVAMCHPSGRLYADTKLFLNTGSLTPALQSQRGRFKMLQLAERSVERLHRLTKLAVQRAPHHSPPVLSLALRLPEIEAYLDADSSHVLAFAKVASELHHPETLAEVG